MKTLIFKGYSILLDDHDYELALSLQVRVVKVHKKYYAFDIHGARLHRIILGITDANTVVDHINGNTLDNRRENLRPCSQRNNTKNRKKSDGKFTSQYKGVHWWNGWLSQIRVDYKKIHLGTYKTEKDAAIAYNKAAKKYFGEFALLNEFPN